MSHFYEVLARKVDQWRRDGYPAPEYPAIAEVFEWATDPETGTLRFLRKPQLRALETYWYLRLVEDTPRVFALYQKLFPNPSDVLEALGLAAPGIMKLVAGQPLDSLWERIKTDDRLVREFRLESVRETLTSITRATSWLWRWGPGRPCSSAPSSRRSLRWRWSIRMVHSCRTP